MKTAPLNKLRETETKLAGTVVLLRQAEAERDQLRAELTKIKKHFRQPTHGPCCTCQRCGKDYDECRCSLDEVVDELAAARQEIADRADSEKHLTEDVVRMAGELATAKKKSCDVCVWKGAGALIEELAAVKELVRWNPISTAPKDRPIIAICNHDADEYHIGDGRLTTYGAHCEGLSHVADGIHVVEWGGEYSEYDSDAGVSFTIPDWWFRTGSDFEEAANPTHWLPIPPMEDAG